MTAFICQVFVYLASVVYSGLVSNEATPSLFHYSSFIAWSHYHIEVEVWLWMDWILQWKHDTLELSIASNCYHEYVLYAWTSMSS